MPLWGGAAAVAEVADEIVGGVVVEPDPTVPTGWRLCRLYVRPDHWGGGVGQELLRRGVERAIEDAAGGMNLWVLEPNASARRFYERHGWRPVPGPTMPNEGSDVVDVLYQLDDLG